LTEESTIRHRRATELFLEATALQGTPRKEFFDRLEQEDPNLKREVESLLQHHSPVPLIPDGDTPELPDARAVGPVKRLESSGQLRTGEMFSRLLGGPIRRTGATLSAALVLITLGFWTHSRVSNALLDLRANELETVLKAQVSGLERWIQGQISRAKVLAADPRMVRATQESKRLTEVDGVAHTDLPNYPAHDQIGDLISSSGASGGGSVWDYVGRPFYTPDGMDVSLSPEAMPFLTEVMEGRTRFRRPHHARDMLRTDRESGTMYCWVETPVLSAEGEVIANLVLAERAGGPFTEIIGSAALGETGETYAFAEDGVMLSRSRFDDTLRTLGLVHEAVDTTELPEWELSTLLHFQVRDPGGNVLEGHRSEHVADARPLTQLAALAIGSRNLTDSTAHRGLVLEPYRNYMGVEVIGAWSWLPEHEFGVATEMEVDEAFAPLRYLEISFFVLFGVLVVAAGAALFSSMGLVRLRRRLGQLRQLGQYTLIEEIGAGGMGTVFLAQHAMLKRPTAVKVMTSERVTDESITRFEREVQLASNLTHPNTIEIYDYGRTPDGVFYYAMEYLPGLSLAELVSNHGPVPSARAVHIMRQVCYSLDEAHRQGIIHRDIKPQNLMLCERGGRYDVVKVLDFGLVKKIFDPNTLELTGPARIGGTLMYMAPERIEAPHTVDQRTDIYSLGAVAYYLVTGRQVFPYEDEVDLLYKIVSTMPAEPSHVVDHPIDSDLEQLIMACLSKDPDARPSTVAEVRKTLRSIVPDHAWSPADAEQWWCAQQAISAG
jgi:hypothetical protein